MSISNRIKKLISTESRYFNSSWSKLLTVLTYFLMILNAVLSIYNFVGISDSAENSLHLNNSLYLLITFIILHIIALRVKEIIGNGYLLSMLFTAISFAASYISSYLLFDTAWSIEIDRLLDHPFGFGPTLKNIGILSLRFALFTLLFYFLLTFIPAINSRSKFLGYFYPILILSTIFSVFIVVFISSFIPEEQKAEYAEKASLIYLSAMSVLSVKFLYKSLLYAFSSLLPFRKESVFVNIPEDDIVSEEIFRDNIPGKTEVSKEIIEINEDDSCKSVRPQIPKSEKSPAKKPAIDFGRLLLKLKKPSSDSGDKSPILTLAFTVELTSEDELILKAESTATLHTLEVSEKVAVKENFSVDKTESPAEENNKETEEINVKIPTPLLTHSFLIERTE